MKKYFWIILGTINLILGTIGIVLPILPTVPFYLVTFYCYARGSRKLQKWFMRTNVYKNNLRPFIKQRGMTMGAKIKLISTVTVLMGVGFYMMEGTTAGRIVLVIVWLVHLYIVFMRMKTIKEQQ
ncbi:MAG: YbaN family protein [Anaerovibrio sp.]|uniref:YbaN family protein n=1 Tax=Anaerovibrio sp. TaxID=1872532 RepID=UPI0025EF7372|nr:YbaN family protein [Anaerovibrio sp.]MCR5175491.1 YbaN family protein [Anaerovibrio sp.]